ncbi:MAG: hypothetical protein U0599_16780 [Vicinamibacteria bacterium]
MSIGWLTGGAPPSVARLRGDHSSNAKRMFLSASPGIRFAYSSHASGLNCAVREPARLQLHRLVGGHELQARLSTYRFGVAVEVLAEVVDVRGGTLEEGARPVLLPPKKGAAGRPGLLGERAELAVLDVAPRGFLGVAPRQAGLDLLGRHFRIARTMKLRFSRAP